MALKHVEGEKRGHIMLYAISTCAWCKKTKRLLDEMGIDYYYIYVDLLEGAEKVGVVKEILRHNPSRSFPTIVVDNERAIMGYKEDQIRRLLKDE